MGDPGPEPTWLKAELTKRGIKPKDVAAATGRSTATVYYWLNGRTKPEDDVTGALADVLEITESELRHHLGLYLPGDTGDVIDVAKARKDGAMAALGGVMDHVAKLMADISGQTADLEQKTG